MIIFISFTGLFGLISFVATQRTREIAIRKVLGASSIELVKMLNGSFIFMVFIANIVAWPFLIAMCISMLITLVTVSIRSYRAAKGNTIDALKYE